MGEGIVDSARRGSPTWRAVFLAGLAAVSAANVGGAEPVILPADQPPVIPVGLDAYRQWDRWPYQRIGARAYMRSTYDRSGNNETADASHFLYQLAEDFHVTLDVEGAGLLYFKRTNHWHGSPWHYEVDGKRHVVQETTTADPTRKLDHAVFLPEQLFPHPLTWTYSQTHGADLMWVPIPFEQRLRLAYSRTFYGTGYYIYQLLDPAAPLSQPIRAWDGRTPPGDDVLGLLRAAGTDIAPRRGDGSALGQLVEEARGTVGLIRGERVELATLTHAPSMVRALELSAPREQAVAFGRAMLRVTWDGREHPSVDAPVALFFGSGTLHNRDNVEYLVRALPVHIRFDEKRVYLACYFPMPFFRSARFELQGPEEAAIDDVQWAVRTVPYSDPPNHVGYFHATYRDHAAAEPGRDLVFLDTRESEGGGDWSGSFVGTSFVFSDRGVLNTLEGDPRFLFDDSQTPQAQGTGTEEWGGGGDYWGGRNMTIPLAGHPVGVRRTQDATCEEELIHSAYRYLLADLMPFGKRALIRFEHGAVNLSEERYRSVACWYGLPAASLVLTDELDVGDAASEQAHRALPGQPPQVVTFDRGGAHRLRVQLRHSPHEFDQIWLSATQKTRPKAGKRQPPAANNDLGEIVLDARDPQQVAGNMAVVQDFSASRQRAFAVGAVMTEVYPAHTETGRITEGSSEFTVRLRPENFGVLLRRTLDFQYPNQRAEVYVAD